MVLSTSSRASGATAVAIAAGGALVVAALATILPKTTSSGSDDATTTTMTTTSTALASVDDEINGDDGGGDFITEDVVVSVFDGLFVHMQGVLSQLGQQIQQIQMSGQTIPEKQLRQLLKAEFERALLAHQSKVYEANNVDEECLEQATWEMLADESKVKARKAVERFQKLYERVTGETVTGGGGAAASSSSDEVLTQQKLLAAAQVYFDALTASMAAVVQTYKDKGANLFDPTVAQQLQMEFGKEANDAGEKALTNMGVTQDVFKRSIEKHANNPEVARALAMLQMKQQQALMAMGVPAM